MLLGLLLGLAPALSAPSAQDLVPGESWERYATPGEAGFDAAKLDEARAYYDTLDAAGAMIVYRGAVLDAWGDVERRFMCHSVRKSLLSALFGPHVEAGTIDLDRTLGELGVDDVEPALTDVEKAATIRQLLQARSGVYRLAAYEPPENPKPERGAHAPGELWCYNNWDFNALCTIFEQETGAKLFEDFAARIAEPIGMQDYRPRDGYYHYERDKSIHPAYPFRLSARDMARFGLLVLREGRWGGRQVLPAAWIEESTASYSDAGPRGGYGYMWWIPDGELASHGAISALGFGGHAIDVLPGAELVFVLRVNTFERRRVRLEHRHRLLGMILDARAGEPKPEPRLTALEAEARSELRTLPPAELEQLVGEFPDGQGGTLNVALKDGELFAEIANAGAFDLLPLVGGRFELADYRGDPVAFERDADGRATAMVIDSWPEDVWPRSTPLAEDVDGDALAALDREIRAGEFGLIDSLLVVRHGRAVFDATYSNDYARLSAGRDPTPHQYNYFHPSWHPYYAENGESGLHTMQSVTKSVTSMLVGVALLQEHIESTDVPALSFFAGREFPDPDGRKAAMTLEDVLTMRAGFAWDEWSFGYEDPRNDCIRLEAQGDWIAFVLAKPMAADPGTTFVYNSGASHLLSGVVKDATGETIDAFAEEHLFAPVGIDAHHWKKTPSGLPDTEGGLYLEPGDLARLGLLMLRDGLWREQRVLPEGWVERSVTPWVADIAPDNPRRDDGYGYKWWILDDGQGENPAVYAALGFGGQYLLVAPELELICVATGWNIYGRARKSIRSALVERVIATAGR